MRFQWASVGVKSQDFNNRALPANEIPKEISREEAKRIQPRMDKKARNVLQCNKVPRLNFVTIIENHSQ